MNTNEFDPRKPDTARRPSESVLHKTRQGRELSGHPLVELRSLAPFTVNLLAAINMTIKADDRQDLTTLATFLKVIIESPAASDPIREAAERALEQIKAGTYTFAQD